MVHFHAQAMTVYGRRDGSAGFFVMMCAAVILAIAVVCPLSVRSVVLEEPWTPENEVFIPVHMIRRGLLLTI